MNPFDLPGPSFLALWLVGLIVVIPLMLVLRQRSQGDSRAAGPDAVATQLDPIEIAYLAGGIERAVEAAVAGLAHRWMLEVKGDALFRIDSAGPPFRGVTADDELSELERLVLRCAGGPTGTSIDQLIAAAASLDVELHQRLSAEGLLVADPAAARMHAAIPGALWLGFGGIKLMVGLSRGRSVEILLWLLVSGAVAVIALARKQRLTSFGRRVVERLTERAYGLQTTATAAPAQLAASDMTLAYGLFGATVVLGDLAAVMPSYHRSLAATTTSSGSSCGSSSSCGGGGGGCGGCGGCS